MKKGRNLEGLEGLEGTEMKEALGEHTGLTGTGLGLDWARAKTARG